MIITWEFNIKAVPSEPIGMPSECPPLFKQKAVFSYLIKLMIAH